MHSSGVCLWLLSRNMGGSTWGTQALVHDAAFALRSLTSRMASVWCGNIAMGAIMK